MLDSADKVAVVTGAARGIGLAIARRFLAERYCVALLDIDGATLARADRALGAPARVLAVECDVAEPRQVDAAIARVEARFGRVDALVNNAGIAVFKPLLETSFEEWSRVLAVISMPPAWVCRRCVPTK
jgi:NAD(P)-dependent dehydrogenase (short-subunit alcohol dehydrogenase family)